MNTVPPESPVELSQAARDDERLRSLGALSAGVAHHFNNLLSVILGYSSHLLNREELSEDAERGLRQISEAAQKGRRLTEEILAFSGSEVEEVVACSMHDILRGVLSLLITQMAGRIKVVEELNATRDSIRGPRSLLHQLAFNLLTNAMDSMPEGGTLHLETSNVDGPMDNGEQVEHLLISVKDSGSAGRPHERADKLQDLMDRLDGSASTTSEIGAMRSAQIMLPLGRSVSKPAIERPSRKRLAPSLIWIVDDDPIFCEMCERVLSDDGHEVRTLTNGSELLKEWPATDVHPNLLIIDFSMPEYSGSELCTWLREQGSKAPIILVSGLAPTQPDIHKALKMRKTYFLQKPFPVPELADIVTVALGETLLGE